ncbi:MAG TPA: twin-arginine translocase subunit TatC [Mycobacteriales bacterium]|nr:twin-arginine translocase subunit TatC [Mycobacteriales bacterium]
MTLPKPLRRVLRRRPRNDDGTMSLRDHIAELRSRLLKALFFVLLGAVVGWILYPSILDLLKEPYCQLPADRRFQPSAGGATCQLAFFGPLDGFVLRLKVGAICGVILAAPFWLYQVWAFVTPGLRRNERRWSILFVAVSTMLFAAGAVLSYFTIEKALSLLVNLAGSGTVAVIAVPNYVGFVTSMLLVFGVAFELPLLVVMLNLVGVLSAARLRRWQRMAIFLIFVFAAVATPSQDPISMCMLAIPMSVLFEIAVVIAAVHDRRKARREAAESFAHLPDDVASPLEATLRPIDEPADEPAGDVDQIDEIRR